MVRSRPRAEAGQTPGAPARRRCLRDARGRRGRGERRGQSRATSRRAAFRQCSALNALAHRPARALFARLTADAGAGEARCSSPGGGEDRASTKSPAARPRGRARSPSHFATAAGSPPTHAVRTTGHGSARSRARGPVSRRGHHRPRRSQPHRAAEHTHRR